MIQYKLHPAFESRKIEFSILASQLAIETKCLAFYLCPPTVYTVRGHICFLGARCIPYKQMGSGDIYLRHQHLIRVYWLNYIEFDQGKWNLDSIFHSLEDELEIVLASNGHRARKRERVVALSAHDNGKPLADICQEIATYEGIPF